MFLQNTIVCGNSADQIAGTGWADQGGNTIEEDCESCTGDIDGNGLVGIDDLLALLNYWGMVNSVTDLNEDGFTDIKDLLILIGAWGFCE